MKTVPIVTEVDLTDSRLTKPSAARALTNYGMY